MVLIMLMGLISEKTPGLSPSAEDSSPPSHFPTDHKVLTNGQSPNTVEVRQTTRTRTKAKDKQDNFAQTLNMKLPTVNLKLLVFIGITLIIFSLYSSTTGVLPTSSLSTIGI
jgi:hypothetical protein